MKKVWEYWCKAIGKKEYTKDKDADKVAVIRTIWILLHIVTCLFIIVGNGRLLEIW
tara:strand:- start:38 stop:205 length:168 start_codon:yes stop_codon:yes gene_type:complete